MQNEELKIKDSKASVYLKQALGNDLVPINFEIKSRKKLLAEQANKNRAMDN